MSSDFAPIPATIPTSDAEACEPVAGGEPAWLAERACCCSARPRFRVLLPGGADGNVDLLFCGHHFRLSAPRLADLGAWVYDCANTMTAASDWTAAVEPTLP